VAAHARLPVLPGHDEVLQAASAGEGCIVSGTFGTGPGAPFVASKRVGHDGSRRLVIAGVSYGEVTGAVYGPHAAADALLDALAEGFRQPRGHFLRLYRERRARAAARGERG
jgi:hypothetical protein